MKLAFSTNAYLHHSFADAVARLARIGYPAVEIMADVPHAWPAFLLDEQKQKTANDEQNLSTMLIGKKAGKKIAHGQMVILQVKNRDGRVSEPFSFTRP